MTRAVEISFMMVCFTWVKLTTWTSGELVQLVLQPGAVGALLSA